MIIQSKNKKWNELVKDHQLVHVSALKEEDKGNLFFSKSLGEVAYHSTSDDYVHFYKYNENLGDYESRCLKRNRRTYLIRL